MKLRPLATALALILAAQQPAQACSSFLLRSPGGPVMGRNADSTPLPGLMIVNHRGVEKRAMNWGIVGPGPAGQLTAHWVSRYGSVTATSVGREFPDGGMNEAGLAVEEMTLLESRFPKAEGQPTIPQIQWLQYLLDTKGSVDEVLADLDRFKLSGWTWHFMVADRTGACATIDFLDGKAVVGRGTLEAGCVLTNDNAGRSNAYLKGFSGFGGEAKAPEGSASLARFVRASTQLNAYQSRPEPGRIAYAFSALADISDHRYTIRSFVHDLRARRIYFRTPAAPQIKYLDFGELDFSAGGRVKMLDIDTVASGDLSRRMLPYDIAANRHVVETFYRTIVGAVPAGLKIFHQELDAAGISEADFVDRVSTYPETTRRARGKG